MYAACLLPAKGKLKENFDFFNNTVILLLKVQLSLQEES